MLKIVKGIFGIDPTDMLQGLKQTNPLEGGMFPDLTPKMMIGEGGLSNLEKAGMPQRLSSEDLAMAQFDLNSLGKEGTEAKTDWLKKGVEIDPLADKVMYEIPDNEVRLLKGRKLEDLNGEYGFSELFKADLLINAYPDLENLKINIINKPKSNTAGSFDPINNVLVLNRGHDYIKKDIKKTLLHEVQHFVQEKENFTRGESFPLRLLDEQDYVLGTKAMKKALTSDLTSKDLAKMLVENEGLNFNATKVQQAMVALAEKPDQKTEEVLQNVFGSKEMAEKFISRAKQYPALKGFLESKELAEEGYLKAFDKYQKVAGEQFANATAARGNMTADEIYFAPNAYRNDLLSPDNMLPSLFTQKFANPAESSIKSSIPQGL